MATPDLINKVTFFSLLDAKKRATIDAWTDYVSIHVGAAMGRVLFNRVFAPMTGQTWGRPGGNQGRLRRGSVFIPMRCSESPFAWL